MALTAQSTSSVVLGKAKGKPHGALRVGAQRLVGVRGAVHAAAGADAVLAVQTEGNFRVVLTDKVQRNHRTALAHIAGANQPGCWGCPARPLSR